MAATVTNTKIRLNSPRDWTAWSQQLQLQAFSIWPKILGEEAWLSPPPPPLAIGFGTTLPSTPGSDEESTIAARAREAYNKYELGIKVPTTLAERRYGFSHLSKDEKEDYNQAHKEYLVALHEYEAEKKIVEDTRKWIAATINHIYQVSVLNLPSLTDCFDALKSQCEVSKPDQHLKMYDEYKVLLANPPAGKNTKEDKNWLQKWHATMGKLKSNQVASVSDTRTWLHDLVTAVSPGYPLWANRYEESQENRIATFTYEQAYLSLWRGIEDAERAMNQSKNVARGNVNAATLGKKEGKSKKRSRESSVECSLCEIRGHKAENCWHDDPSKAPDWFITNEELLKKVQANKKENRSTRRKATKSGKTASADTTSNSD